MKDSTPELSLVERRLRARAEQAELRAPYADAPASDGLPRMEAMLADARLDREAADALAEQAAVREELCGALRDCMIGGNHLALILIHRLGPTFSSRWPPEKDAAVVLEEMGGGVNYDVWCCWAALMRARAALAKAAP